MRILLVGMSHKSASVEIRERYAVDEVGPILAKLTDLDEIDEAVAISTCNRVEIVVSTRQMEAARHTLYQCFHADLGGGASLPDGSHLDDHVYEYFDQDAVTHVFRVASSIDSMVVGEPQILGQMKDAYRDARETGSCGPLLSRLYQRAFATAKRVKNETLVARRPVSVARVAVELARQIFEDLQTKQALMIGAGEMIEASLFALRRQGLGGCRVANRTRSNASELAARFGADAHGLGDLDQLLSDSDIVLSCIGSTEFILDADRLSQAMAERRRRPIFLIDMGVPRNIDPDVDSLENVYLYDIDDLQQVAQSNEAERQRESQDAERIVLEEQERFVGWMVALQSVPTIQHLRARAESIRISELERSLSRMDLDESERDHVDGLTRSIVNKLLHPPLSRLKAQTDREEGLAVLEEARALFALDDETAPGSEVDEVYTGDESERALKETLASLDGEEPE